MANKPSNTNQTFQSPTDDADRKDDRLLDDEQLDGVAGGVAEGEEEEPGAYKPWRGITE
jgi:hypothetical protein